MREPFYRLSKLGTLFALQAVALRLPPERGEDDYNYNYNYNLNLDEQRVVALAQPAPLGLRQFAAATPLSLLDVSVSRAEGPFGGFHKKKRHTWYFGAHHKTGTILLNRLALILGRTLEQPTCSINGMHGSCGSFGPSCWQSPNTRVWFDCHTTGRSLERARELANGTMRAVHIVRDPASLVVSGYVYHLHNNDGGRAELLQRLSLAEGVESEAQYALDETLPAMLEAAKEGLKAHDTLNVRLEDFMNSSASFDTTVEKVFKFAVRDVVDESTLRAMVSSAASEDLMRHPYTSHSSALVNPDLTRQARQALEELPQEIQDRLSEYRRAFGYA